MRVLLINAVYKTGSTGRMLVEMAEYYKKNDIEVYIACAQGCDKEDRYQYSIGNKLDWKLHALKSRITGYQGNGSILQTYKLIQHIKRIKPDVVHLHNLHSNYINVHLLLRFLSHNNIPTIQTLHDCWNYTGKCTHYTLRSCYRWKSGCGYCPNLKENIPSWFFDRTRSMIKAKARDYGSIPRLAVIGVSKWICDEARRSFFQNSRIISYIYNWIDLQIFIDTPSSIRHSLGLENKFVILGVANGWYASKGIDSFIMLASALSDDERIVLVGNMEKRELPTGIISVPATASLITLAQYYSMADVFMQLSPEESFGKVVAESMACGTPIIAIDSTANPELVNDKCGIIVPKDNLEELVSAYKTVKRLKKGSYCTECRKHAEEYFDKDKQIAKYVEIYNRIVNNT